MPEITEKERDEWRERNPDCDILDEQIEVLVEIERELGRPIPYVKSIRHRELGFAADGENVLELGLERGGLKILPETTSKLEYLEKLYLIENKLTNLPDSICDLKELFVLDARSNMLASIPENIGKLRRLRYLELRDNKLTSIPESIGKLVAMERLSLDYNRLKNIPESITQLKSLEKITLSGNKIKIKGALKGWIKELKENLCEVVLK